MIYFHVYVYSYELKRVRSPACVGEFSAYVWFTVVITWTFTFLLRGVLWLFWVCDGSAIICCSGVSLRPRWLHIHLGSKGAWETVTVRERGSLLPMTAFAAVLFLF